MHMCRKANLASSSSWMYIAYKSLLIDLYYPFLISLFLTKRGRKICLIWFYFEPFVDDWQKGEKYLRYMHVFLALLLKGEKNLLLMHICFVLQIGEKDFDLCLLHVLSPYLHTYSCVSLSYLLFIYHAWVKGELLWSFTLIHAYITPWVLSSSKRGRLLAQRPITLVLMRINSCSYSTNDLVFN